MKCLVDTLFYEAFTFNECLRHYGFAAILQLRDIFTVRGSLSAPSVLLYARYFVCMPKSCIIFCMVFC